MAIGLGVESEIQRANFEEWNYHPLQFSDIFLRRYGSTLPDMGHRILELLASRDKRSHFIINHVPCEGKISFLQLQEPVKEMETQFAPYLEIFNESFSNNPYSYNNDSGHVLESISFEPKLLFVALKLAVAGKWNQVSGWGKYHKEEPGSLSTGEDKRLTIKIQISSNSDRANFTFISDGETFAEIDAGKWSMEELYNSKYDQLVKEYWEKHFKMHPANT